MVASYVADSKKLDFLLADRTFSCLSDVALHTFGFKAC